jgi:hypothetical protein
LKYLSTNRGAPCAFYPAVQTGRESSIVFATADVSLRDSDQFRRRLQYEIQHWPRACNSSARQLLAGAPLNRRQNVTRLLQTVCSTDDADDNRTTLFGAANRIIYAVWECWFHFIQKLDIEVRSSETFVTAL